jgi:predicted acylesterase/phospholipase RssA
MEKKWLPNVMICGPAGSRGFLLMGGLKRFYEEKGFLDNVKIWAGVSVGSAISLLIVCGYKIEEIIDICIGVSIIDDVLSINLDEVTKNLGIIKLKSIEDKLKHCVKLKFGFIPTFQQLYALTGLELSVATFNCDKIRPEFLDRHNTPDLCCVEGCIMSMSIPILFQPKKLKSDVQIDGAIGAPLPLSHYDKNGDNVLGMYVCTDENFTNLDTKPINFLYRLIHASMKVLRDMELKYASANVKTIMLKTSYRDTTGLTINEEGRRQMIDAGYQTAHTFLKINTNPEKYDIKLGENEEIPFEL